MAPPDKNPAQVPAGMIVLADGTPIDTAVADQAAEWFTQFMCGPLDDAERLRWQQWRAQHPDHERAWRHLEAVSARIRRSPRDGVLRALAANGADAIGRRQAVRTLLCVFGVGGSALLAARTPGWQRISADVHTDTGERREVALDDGTRLLLDTASAVDLRFGAHERRIQLVAGGILVETAQAGGVDDPRPLVVETAEGRVRALGTRFTVRQQTGSSHVAVLHSAVEITPADFAVAAIRLRAGEQAVFTRDAAHTPSANGLGAAAWTRGELIAEDMRLADVLGELGRYRRGLLRCDPAVAGLRLSGVFPLDDTDRVLTMLPRVLPVQVRRRSRYWTVVEAAD